MNFKIPRDLLSSSTQIFFIERNNSRIGEAHGFFCGKDYPNTIQLVEDTDIKNDDWLIDSISNQRYYVCNARPIIINGEPSDWMVSYQTEREYNLCNSRLAAENTTFNIHSISGNSIIGNQQTATLNAGYSLSKIKDLISAFPEADKEIAKELVDSMEAIENSNHPTLTKGSLSKFSDLLKKHSDLLIAVGGWAVNLLIG